MEKGACACAAIGKSSSPPRHGDNMMGRMKLRVKLEQGMTRRTRRSVGLAWDEYNVESERLRRKQLEGICSTVQSLDYRDSLPPLNMSHLILSFL